MSFPDLSTEPIKCSACKSVWSSAPAPKPHWTFIAFLHKPYLRLSRFAIPSPIYQVLENGKQSFFYSRKNIQCYNWHFYSLCNSTKEHHSDAS